MKFTVRDLLWLMVVVGFAVAWLLERPAFHMSGREAATQRTMQTMGEEIDELKAEIERLKAGQ